MSPLTGILRTPRIGTKQLLSCRTSHLFGHIGSGLISTRWVSSAIPAFTGSPLEEKHGIILQRLGNFSDGVGHVETEEKHDGALRLLVPETETHNIRAWSSLLQPLYEDYVVRWQKHGDASVLSAEDITSWGDGNEMTHNSRAPLDIRVGQIILAAKKFGNHDLLRHAGLTLGRWDVLSWIIRVLTARNTVCEPYEAVMVHEPISIETPYTSRTDMIPLRKLTEDGPIHLKLDRLPEPHKSTAVGDPLVAHAVNQRRKLRIITQMTYEDSSWRHIAMMSNSRVFVALADIIMSAADASTVSESSRLMDHVLDKFAIMHHNNALPLSLYQTSRSIDYSETAHPTFIEELRKTALACILDAEWNVNQEEDEDAAPYTSEAQLPIQGFQLSARNNPKQILPYAHGFWLEYTLWICFRNGSILEGCRLLLNAIEKGWIAKSLPMYSQTGVCHFEYKTITCEVVVAFAKALVVPSATGTDGADAHFIPSTLLRLEALLMAGDSFESRELFTDIWSKYLTSSYDVISHSLPLSSEIVSQLFKRYNIFCTRDTALRYELQLHDEYLLLAKVFDFGLYLLKDQISKGNLRAASHFAELLTQHGAHLPEVPVGADLVITNSTLKIPPIHLAALIHLFVDSKHASEAIKVLFTSHDERPPIIDQSLLSHSKISAAVIRLNSLEQARGAADALASILNSESGGMTAGRLDLITAILCTSIEDRKWNQVQKLLEMLSGHIASKDVYMQIATLLAQELLLLRSSNDRSPDFDQAFGIFTHFIRSFYQNPTVHKVHMTMLLCILASRGYPWSHFAAGFITRKSDIPGKFTVSGPIWVDADRTFEPFSRIVRAVARAKGFEAAWGLFTAWCNSDISTERPGTLTPIMSVREVRDRHLYKQRQHAVRIKGMIVAFDNKFLVDLPTVNALASCMLQEPKERKRPRVVLEDLASSHFGLNRQQFWDQVPTGESKNKSASESKRSSKGELS